MNEILSYAQPVSVLVLVGVCLKLANTLNGKLKAKIDREVCYKHQELIDTKFEHIKETTDRIEKKLDKVLNND